MPVPVLETVRLVLRPFGATDAPDVQRLAGAWDVASSTLTVPHPYPDGAAEAWIATHEAAWEERSVATFAVTGRRTGELIGAIGLKISTPHARAELGYWIGTPYWNNGYCTEAAAAVIEFGFGTLGLNRIQARHFTRNPASGRVMQKVGMRFEGVARSAFLRWDRFEDVAQYGLLAEDRAASTCDPDASPAPRFNEPR